jgi:hypothetical protein
MLRDDSLAVRVGTRLVYENTDSLYDLATVTEVLPTGEFRVSWDDAMEDESTWRLSEFSGVIRG